LEQAFPDAEASLGLAARQAQAAAELAREIAAIDLTAVSDPQGLQLEGWLALSPARRRNVLRAWLKLQMATWPPATLLDRLMSELSAAHGGTWPAPLGLLRAHRGRLVLLQESLQLRPPKAKTSEQELVMNLGRPGRFPVPSWAGAFVVSTCQQRGVPAHMLKKSIVFSRQGGEQFQRAPAGALRSLKKQFQAADVPAWRRDGPLVRTPSGDLLFVPQLGMNALFWAAPGEPQLTLHWSPEQPETAGPSQPHG
jgi:tRNA(Ile)-lysidine synthase